MRDIAVSTRCDATDKAVIFFVAGGVMMQMRRLSCLPHVDPLLKSDQARSDTVTVNILARWC